jgi:hypothetical protein
MAHFVNPSHQSVYMSIPISLLGNGSVKISLPFLSKGSVKHERDKGYTSNNKKLLVASLSMQFVSCKRSVLPRTCFLIAGPERCSRNRYLWTEIDPVTQRLANVYFNVVIRQCESRSKPLTQDKKKWMQHSDRKWNCIMISSPTACMLFLLN